MSTTVLDRPDTAWLDEAGQTARFTRWQCAPDGRREAESSLRLSGLDCAACALPIEQALRAVDGVLEASVDAAGLRATVRWDPARTAPSALVAAVRRAGFEAGPDTAAGARALRQAESRQALWRLFVAAFCAMQVMMLATPAYVAGPDGIAPDLKRLLDWGSWVMTLPVLLFSAAPFFRGALGALAQRRLAMELPVALGLAVGFVASSAAAIDPRGPFGPAVYFDSLTMFVAFLLAARWLELRVRHRAAATLEDALGALPETADRLMEDGRIERVALARLQPGDRLRVAVGAGFPADGVLIDGATSADESLLSGESRPQPKAPGDALLAGSVNLAAPATMRVEHCGADTRYEAIVALMREAQAQRPAAARWADRWAGPFLWVVLLLAAGAAAAWSVVDPARAVWVAVSVLIVTCPCALSLATPAALLVATDALARRGVLLRRPEALETVARCTRLFVDKTGTLTEDRLRLAAVQRLGGGRELDRDALLAHAAGLAAWSRHPLSRALADARGSATTDAPDANAWRAVREQPGAGLEALGAEGRAWRLGSARWVGGVAEAGPDTVAAPGPALWFGPSGRALARFDFEEALRPGAAAALRRLADDGLRASLLSGDAPARVERLAARLPLDAATGGADPAAKLAALAAAQARGEVVAMLGDGINDAPVLARADVSLAMGSGALLARAQADAVLLRDRLDDVAALRTLSRRTLRVIRQNIAWAAAYNLACVPLALAGLLPPWAAGLGMAASSLAVVGNAVRLAR
ncbi:cation-translocating P-type ATPase [uncultured Methylibium sp.]|uniref:heavy metal translocating P-type ATPase n=1 Tax=uncultured Methylibium sp. TaxID=381093 RepID=UPI0025FDE823|nr:cation-translocating P-type ATPase [uncultured Methylibium sp.]